MQESVILLHRQNEIRGIRNNYRLIETRLAHGDLIYSVFLTTQDSTDVTEEFAFDVAPSLQEAFRFFDLIETGNVTACTLNDVAQDYRLPLA